MISRMEHPAVVSLTDKYMTRQGLLIILFGSMILLTGCGNQNRQNTGNVSRQLSVEDVLQQGMAEADKKAGNDPEIITAEPTSVHPELVINAPTPEISAASISEMVVNDAEGIDIDMTKMSATMIYAEVFSMLTTPEDYLGKKIRIRGEFSGFYDKTQDKNYYACLIRDAMACCAQGLEFILNDDCSYPEDYPKRGDEITITGIFASYQEGNFTFYHLADSVWNK